MNDLVSGKLYWVRDIRSNIVYLAEYYKSDLFSGWFNLLGTDEGFGFDPYEVLSEVELVVPDYAKETGYGK